VPEAQTVDTRSAALSADAAALLAEYYHYTDLAEHVRALPEAAAVLGKPRGIAERNSILAELEAQILNRLERLDVLGLYPTTTTAVDVTLNGVSIALPELCRESTTNALPDVGSPTKEACMHTAIEPAERRAVQECAHRLRIDRRQSTGPNARSNIAKIFAALSNRLPRERLCDT